MNGQLNSLIGWITEYTHKPPTSHPHSSHKCICTVHQI